MHIVVLRHGLKLPYLIEEARLQKLLDCKSPLLFNNYQLTH